MHTAIGRTIKYVLRVLLVFILWLLLIGLIKYRGDVGAYINFLNTRDRREAREQLSIGHPSTFAYMFRGSGLTTTGWIDILSGEVLSGDLLTGDTGLNAYDPNREADLDAMTGNDLTDSGVGGFKAPNTVAPTPASSASGEEADSAKAQLLNLIKKREMNK